MVQILQTQAQQLHKYSVSDPSAPYDPPFMALAADNGLWYIFNEDNGTIIATLCNGHVDSSTNTSGRSGTFNQGVLVSWD